MTARSRPDGPRARWPVRLAAAAVMIVLLGLVGAAAYAVGVLRTPPPPAPVPPLVVRVEPARVESGYVIERRFTGRVEPRRASAVGFELAGAVASIAVDEGDLVDAGDRLARLDVDRLEARRAELVASADQAEARRRLARATLERTLESARRSAATEQEVDAATAARDVAESTVEEIRRRIDAVDVDLAKSVLGAPFDAVVARRFVDEGHVVEAGAPILELLERTAPEVRIGLPPSVATHLAIGRSLEVRIGDRAVAASIVALLPETDRRTRTVELVCRLDAELDGLRRGDLASIDLDRRVEAEGTWLPVAALTESARGLWSCLVAMPDPSLEIATHRLEPRQLEIEHVRAERVFTRGTLEDGELVVVDGLHRVVPGQAVRLAGEVAR